MQGAAGAAAGSNGWKVWAEPTNLDWCQAGGGGQAVQVKRGLPEHVEATGGPLHTGGRPLPKDRMSPLVLGSLRLARCTGMLPADRSQLLRNTDYLQAELVLPAGAAWFTAMASPTVGGPVGGGLHSVDGFVADLGDSGDKGDSWGELAADCGQRAEQCRRCKAAVARPPLQCRRCNGRKDRLTTARWRGAPPGASSHLAIAPNYPTALPKGGGGQRRLVLRMAGSGLPNYLWSDPLCKKGQCNGNWDPHLENYDQGLLGPVILNSSDKSVLKNITHGAQRPPLCCPLFVHWMWQ